MALLNAAQRSSEGVGMNWSAMGELLSTLNNPKDWIQCCLNINIPLLEVFLQVLQQPAARNNFDEPRVNNIKGHFNWIALAYPHFVCWYRLVS